jgi:hypothetical protein
VIVGERSVYVKNNVSFSFFCRNPMSPFIYSPLLLFLLHLLHPTPSQVHATTPSTNFSTTINASQFDRYWLYSGNVNEVMENDDLAGRVSTIRGWFEYDLEIPVVGWYTLTTPVIGM